MEMLTSIDTSALSLQVKIELAWHWDRSALYIYGSCSCPKS